MPPPTAPARPGLPLGDLTDATLVAEGRGFAHWPRGVTCPARCRRSWHRQPRSIPAPPWRRTPVRCRMSGNAPQDEQVGQNVDHIDRLELAGDTDRQAFMAELVEHVEHPVPASIVGAILDEVIGPHMIALLRP